MTAQGTDDEPTPPAGSDQPPRRQRRPVRRRGYEASLRPGESGAQPGPPAAMTVDVTPPDQPDHAAKSAMESDS